MTLSFFSSSPFRLALRRPCHRVTTSHQHQPSPDKTGQFLSDWLCQIQGYTPNATNVALIAYRAERGGGIARADMKGVTGAACETKNKDGSSAYITLTSCPPCPLCLFTPSVLHRSLSLSLFGSARLDKANNPVGLSFACQKYRHWQGLVSVISVAADAVRTQRGRDRGLDVDAIPGERAR